MTFCHLQLIWCPLPPINPGRGRGQLLNCLSKLIQKLYKWFLQKILVQLWRRTMYTMCKKLRLCLPLVIVRPKSSYQIWEICFDNLSLIAFHVCFPMIHQCCEITCFSVAFLHLICSENPFWRKSVWKFHSDTCLFHRETSVAPLKSSVHHMWIFHRCIFFPLRMESSVKTIGISKWKSINSKVFSKCYKVVFTLGVL